MCSLNCFSITSKRHFLPYFPPDKLLKCNFTNGSGKYHKIHSLQKDMISRRDAKAAEQEIRRFNAYNKYPGPMQSEYAARNSGIP